MYLYKQVINAVLKQYRKTRGACRQREDADRPSAQSESQHTAEKAYPRQQSEDGAGMREERNRVKTDAPGFPGAVRARSFHPSGFVQDDGRPQTERSRGESSAERWRLLQPPCEVTPRHRSASAAAATRYFLTLCLWLWLAYSIHIHNLKKTSSLYHFFLLLKNIPDFLLQTFKTHLIRALEQRHKDGKAKKKSHLNMSDVFTYINI